MVLYFLKEQLNLFLTTETKAHRNIPLVNLQCVFMVFKWFITSQRN